MPRRPTTAALICHPSTPSAAVQAITARLTWSPDGSALSLAWSLSGEIARLKVPAPAQPARVDGLWQHTCCELFIAGERDPAYREFNFSPSGQWAAYGFADYRRRAAIDPGCEPPPAIMVRQRGDNLELTATIARAALPAVPAFELGLSVVVEQRDGSLSYWALQHPAARPDFHHRGAFVLRLEAPAPSHVS